MAARSVILPAQTEVSVTFISSATDDAADNIVVDEAMNNLLRSRESQQPQKLFLQEAAKALRKQKKDKSLGTGQGNAAERRCFPTRQDVDMHRLSWPCMGIGLT